MQRHPVDLFSTFEKVLNGKTTVFLNESDFSSRSLTELKKSVTAQFSCLFTTADDVIEFETGNQALDGQANVQALAWMV